jgi:hypothetical protein
LPNLNKVRRLLNDAMSSALVLPARIENSIVGRGAKACPRADRQADMAHNLSLARRVSSIS